MVVVALSLILDDIVNSTFVLTVFCVIVWAVYCLAFPVLFTLTPLIVVPTLGVEDCGMGVSNNNRYNFSFNP